MGRDGGLTGGGVVKAQRGGVGLARLVGSAAAECHTDLLGVRGRGGLPTQHAAEADPAAAR